MSIVKKLASQTAVYGLSTMVGRFINYLLVPIYTAVLLNIADYGVVSVMFSYASLFSVIFAMGLETAFFHFAQKTNSPEQVFSNAVHALILSGLIWLIVARIFSNEIMAFIGYSDHPEYAFWFALILVFDSISALGFAWFRFKQQPWKFASIKLTNIIINVFFNLFFLFILPKLPQSFELIFSPFVQKQNQVSYIFFSSLLAAILTIPLMYKTFKYILLGIDFELLKKMLKYSYPLIFIGLAGMINETFDRILLKKILPESQADYQTSIYSAFYKLSMILTLFVQAFRFAVEPFFFQQSKNEDSKTTYAYVMKWFVYAVSVIYLFTLCILPWIAPLLIRNPEYFKDPNGLAIVPYLLAANLFLGIYYTLSVWYKVSDKTKIGTIPAIFGAFLTIILNIILIPILGIKGSAITTLIVYFSMVIVGYFLSRKHYPIPYNLPLILSALVLCFVLGDVILQLNFTPLHTILRITLFIIFIMGIYIYEKKSV
jgi:O-antigen/teichoic acid export membrane protein